MHISIKGLLNQDKGNGRFCLGTAHYTGYLMDTFSKIAFFMAVIDATLVFNHCLQMCVLTIKTRKYRKR